MQIDRALEEGTVSVVVDASGPKPDQHAAAELATYLGAIGGHPVPVCRTPPEDGIRLLVGDAAISSVAPAALGSLEEDEVEIRKLRPGDLALRGGGPRGTLYAVYELLEHLGVRWFHPEETYVPKTTSVGLPDSVRRKPAFEYREAHWHAAYCDKTFAARLRYNGSMAGVPARLGGHWGWQPYVHTFFAAVPPQRYARRHPEYYSYRRGQGRVVHGGQLCLSHPDVVDLLTEFALEKMASPTVRIVDLSQMDHANPCECTDCAKQDRRAGSHSGSLLAMCNEVAARTSKNHPDKCIATLAYTYTVKPPRGLKAHPNVIVRLCHMNGCETHPLDGCERNRRFLDQLKGWREAADRIYVWDYDTNFQHVLYFHPNFEAVRADLRIFRDVGVRGLFLQGYAEKGVAFNEQHAYAMARCLWDPRRDYFEEAQAFLRGYYGEGAAPHLWQMIRTLQGRRRKDLHLHLYRHPHLGTFRRAQLRAAHEHLVRAQQAVCGDDQRARRLDQVSLWMDFTRMATAKPVEKRLNAFRIHSAGDHAPACYESVRKGLKRFGIRRICEFPTSMNRLSTAWAWSLEDRDLPLTVLENDQTRVELSPELNGMVCSLLDKRSGIDLLCKPHPDILAYPYMGGTIEGVDLDTGAAGFREFDRWRLVETDAQRVFMRLRPGRGLLIEREIALLADTSGIRITSAIINCSEQPQALSPHCFVLFQTGRLEDVHFFKRVRDGSLADLENGMRAGANMEQWVNLSGDAVPDKLWGFFNPRLRIGLSEEVNRLPAFCGSNGYTETAHVLMETRLRPVTVRPRGRTIFRRIYRVLRRSPPPRSSSLIT